MSAQERLKELPGYLAFNAGVMFFIGLASRLTSEAEGLTLGGAQLRLMGFAVLLAVLAMAAGFASVARIEFAKRAGKAFSIAWILPSVAVGLPLGRALGVGAELAHSSIRFGLGRFNVNEEVDYAAKRIIETVNKLREMSPLYEMAKEGVDLKSVQWAAH